MNNVLLWRWQGAGWARVSSGNCNDHFYSFIGSPLETSINLASTWWETWFATKPQLLNTIWKPILGYEGTIFICDQFLTLAKVIDKCRENVKIVPSQSHWHFSNSYNNQNTFLDKEWTSLATNLWTFLNKITLGIPAFCQVCHVATTLTRMPLVDDEMLRKSEGIRNGGEKNSFILTPL